MSTKLAAEGPSSDRMNAGPRRQEVKKKAPSNNEVSKKQKQSSFKAGATSVFSFLADKFINGDNSSSSNLDSNEHKLASRRLNMYEFIDQLYNRMDKSLWDDFVAYVIQKKMKKEEEPEVSEAAADVSKVKEERQVEPESCEDGPTSVSISSDINQSPQLHAVNTPIPFKKLSSRRKNVIVANSNKRRKLEKNEEDVIQKKGETEAVVVADLTQVKVEKEEVDPEPTPNDVNQSPQPAVLKTEIHLEELPSTNKLRQSKRVKKGTNSITSKKDETNGNDVVMGGSSLDANSNALNQPRVRVSNRRIPPKKILCMMIPQPLKSNKIDASRNRKDKCHSCPTCKKRFSYKCDLSRHLIVHLEAEEKAKVKEGWKYPCYFCLKPFQFLSDLEKHIRAHNLEKPFRCDLCGRQFSQNDTLSYHKALHINPRQFSCATCAKLFTSKSHLTDHIKSVHLKLRNYRCAECGQEFYSKYNMLKHCNKIHHEVRSS